MKRTTNLIIIDASGSMDSKIESVKSGLKELLAQIKIDAVRDEATVETATIVLDFSAHDDIRTLVNAGNSALLQDDISGNYRTRGATALYDAIGTGFKMVPEGEQNVFVTILTDGEENASKEYKYSDIKKLIEDKKKLGWLITFMGTTESAIQSAQGMGISGGNTMIFADNSKGVFRSSLTASNARAMYYSSATTDSAQDMLSEDSLQNLLQTADKKTQQDLSKEDLKDALKQQKDGTK